MLGVGLGIDDEDCGEGGENGEIEVEIWGRRGLRRRKGEHRALEDEKGGVKVAGTLVDDTFEVSDQ